MVETLRQAIEHWLHQYGPEESSPESFEVMVDDLEDLHRKELPNVTAEALSERTEEIVVAYGAGWGHEELGEEGWEGGWPRALHQVTQRVHGWMLATTAWLYGIPLEGFAYVVPFPPWEEAWEIAHDLWQGTCGCWRVFYPESELKHKRDRRNAHQRAGHCSRTHNLVAWNPSEISLWNFIARAVKGDKRRGQQGKKGFAPAAFSYSMFFRRLYEDHAVRCDSVLRWCCPHHEEIPFEGSQCLECRDRWDSPIFDPSTHDRRVQEMRLLVSEPIGRYASQRFWRCQNSECKNYYSRDFPFCPRCQYRRTRGAALSDVWVLRPRVIVQPSAPVPPLDPEPRPYWPPGPDEDEETVLTRLAVRAAVDQLPPDLREIGEMLRDGMTEEEITDGLQGSLEERREAIAEARERLRILLEPDFGHMDD